MNPSKLEKELRTQIKVELNHLSERLTKELQEILGVKAPESCSSLRFEFDSPEFSDRFPVVYYWLKGDGQASKVQTLLKSTKSTIPEAVLEDPKYDQEGLDTWDIASTEFVSWFAKCWRKAGGRHSTLPAFIAHHDSIYAFDLLNGREVCETDES
ncbi:hypothetical protein [Prosthecobacter sp.]|uniref:hypothetical protein n=1 Tax=Prosthecobacter sp. TaxID=1965333 RepID=UPI002ABA7AC6|nr:hypothetical protein [Prosthecobacter sp.]MDZ4406200.1 hypothetical protein [Prosthecobacter sp.]